MDQSSGGPPDHLMFLLHWCILLIGTSWNRMVTFRAALSIEGSVADTLVAGPQVHAVAPPTTRVWRTPVRLDAPQLVQMVLREGSG